MKTFNFKPISVNEAYIGRRFDSQKKKEFMEKMKKDLLNTEIDCKPPYCLWWRFYVTAASDLDNLIKVATDCVFKHFWINDNLVYKIVAEKCIAKRGKEYFQLEIEHYDNN